MHNDIAQSQHFVPLMEHLPKNLSRFGFTLFIAFIIYLVVPIIDIPVLGLSLSAPVFYIIFMQIFFIGVNKLNFARYRMWILICYFFICAILVSLFGNMILNGSDFSVETENFVMFVRFVYWIMVFITVVYIISSGELLDQIGTVIAIGLIILVILRFIEALSWGSWAGSTQLMTQNGYGIQFSTYFPFLLVLPFTLRGWKRNVSSAILLLAIVTLIGNGSRSSWIAVCLETAVFSIVFSHIKAHGVAIITSRLLLILGVIILVFAILPENVLDPVIARYNTFASLEEDKSFVIRQLMIQKGIRLFNENPIFGIGIGRFKNSTIALDIPTILRYASQAHFDSKSSHNSYVGLLAETGLVGVAPFIVLQLILLSKGVKAVILLGRQGTFWPLAILCGYLGMSLHLWTLSGLTGTGPWFIYGLLAGIIEYARARSTK